LAYVTRETVNEVKVGGWRSNEYHTFWRLAGIISAAMPCVFG
jgi:hypothetical protein